MINAEELGIFKMYFGEIALKYIRMKYCMVPQIGNRFIEFTLANASMATTDLETNLRELDTLHQKFRTENNIKSPYKDSFVETIFAERKDRREAGIRRTSRPV